jgi:hypothetical protein
MTAILLFFVTPILASQSFSVESKFSRLSIESILQYQYFQSADNEKWKHWMLEVFKYQDKINTNNHSQGFSTTYDMDLNQNVNLGFGIGYEKSEPGPMIIIDPKVFLTLDFPVQPDKSLLPKLKFSQIRIRDNGAANTTSDSDRVLILNSIEAGLGYQKLKSFYFEIGVSKTTTAEGLASRLGLRRTEKINYSGSAVDSGFYSKFSFFWNLDHITDLSFQNQKDLVEEASNQTWELAHQIYWSDSFSSQIGLGLLKSWDATIQSYQNDTSGRIKLTYSPE